MEIYKDTQTIEKMLLSSLTTSNLEERRAYLEESHVYSDSIANNLKKLKETFYDQKLLTELETLMYYLSHNSFSVWIEVLL